MREHSTPLHSKDDENNEWKPKSLSKRAIRFKNGPKQPKFRFRSHYFKNKFENISYRATAA